MPRVTAFAFAMPRSRSDRRGTVMLGWALAGAVVAGLVAWSVALAERESRGHTIVLAPL
ncbi:MAG: hypothetical protein JNM47_06955 [Hyphomonadaceae bacterium]|nr:hypothetical protein [Hyphomonadaceae bacterium]